MSRALLVFLAVIISTVAATPGYTSMTGSSLGKMAWPGGLLVIGGSGFTGYTTVKVGLKNGREMVTASVISSGEMHVTFTEDQLRDIDGIYRSGTSQNVYITYDGTHYDCNGCLTLLPFPTISSASISLSYWPACVTGLSPAPTLTISGSNFPPGGMFTIQFVEGGTNNVLESTTSATSVSETQIIAPLPGSTSLFGHCYANVDVRLKFGTCSASYALTSSAFKGCDEGNPSCGTSTNYCNTC